MKQIQDVTQIVDYVLFYSEIIICNKTLQDNYLKCKLKIYILAQAVVDLEIQNSKHAI